MSHAVTAPLLAQLVDQLFSAARARATTSANEVLAPILASMAGDTQYRARTAAEEAECIAADLANDFDKAGKAHRAQERNALRLQINDQTGVFE